MRKKQKNDWGFHLAVVDAVNVREAHRSNRFAVFELPMER
jgi:hypothetical protein